jgi:CubicO group peptidase (beta-lactamase class C family)
MKKKLYTLIVIISLILLGMVVADKTYLLKALRVTYLRGNTDVTIDDFRVQATKTIKASNPQPWQLHEKYNEEPLSKEILEVHKELKSLAFLVVKDGKLLTEQYFAEGGKEHMTSVWSITKTYTSILLFFAVQDGLIETIDDPVTKYIPELNFNQKNELTLRHLASMSTGLFWDEWAHTPFSLIAKLNFYSNLEKFTIKDMYAIGEPGEVQLYNSGATQILGTVLKRVLKEKSITEYLEEKIWNPLGYEYDGLFILDSKKYANEKTYGGIVATARDVAKLGQLFLNEGKWNNQQILSENEIQLIKTIPYNNTTYAFGLWTGLYKGDRYYYQSGFSGQFCITFPKYNLVIVRLGHETTPRENVEDIKPDVENYIEEALRILSQVH